MHGRFARLFASRRALWPVLAALVLRLAAAWAVEERLEEQGADVLVAGDAGGYLDLAADIAERREYAVDSGVFPRKAMRTPLFPLVLAGPLWLNLHAEWLPSRDAVWLCRLAVVFCGVAAVWATGRLGDAIGGPRVGELAAWLAALNPLAIAFSTMLLSESLFAALLTLSVAGVAECVRRDPLTGDEPRSLRWGPAIWAGLAAAGACLTRPVWLPFVPCVVTLGCLLAWRSGDLRRAGWTTAFAIAFLIGFAPWPLRNQRVLGEPVMTTTWGGPTLYDSLGPQATGASDMRFRDRWAAAGGTLRPELDTLPPEQDFDLPSVIVQRFRSDQTEVKAWAGKSIQSLKPEPDAARGEIFKAAIKGDEVASDRLYKAAAWNAAGDDPLRVARLAVVKQGRYWRPWPVGGMPGGVSGLVLKAGFAAFFLPLVGLAAWGACDCGEGGKARWIACGR
ncbi:ArnT family glycosyltransferase [Alienimonas chondri]|uniref:Glycosyltransferase RgtA/B/C/D-like domain-containing protein n=1 Tax=Alienimonas chondri TaxID=2681879 RepID=A0ABX1VHL3_9PLAN|nr:phospholipid carrier-dependent glycosyltransferase [Alienimonas chondri]NNJ26753.1 hypothetical protein [Alienimonas chondri]